MISLNRVIPFWSIYRAFRRREMNLCMFSPHALSKTFCLLFSTRKRSFFTVFLSVPRPTWSIDWDVRLSSRHEPSRRVLSRLCDQSLIEKEPGPRPSRLRRRRPTPIVAEWKLIPAEYDRQCSLLPLFRRVRPACTPTSVFAGYPVKSTD